MPKIDLKACTTRQGSSYPAPFFERSVNRVKTILGDAGGLTQFGVNLVELPPGEWSSQRHWHTEEDEFVYVLEGEVTLITEAGRVKLAAGECAAFAKNVPDGHHLINESSRPARYLEIGTRSAQDAAAYPDIDMALPNKTVGFTRKDGTPYPKR